MFTNMQRHMLPILLVYTIGCRIVNWVTADGCVHIAESVGSRRDLVVNLCTHRRRDATRQFASRRRCVLGLRLVRDRTAVAVVKIDKHAHNF